MRGFLVVAAVSGALLLGGCGDDESSSDASGDSGGSGGVEIPEGATFCSVFDGEYAEALSNAVPATDDGFQDAADAITEWAMVLQQLAPADVADLAQANVDYHRAQANMESASDFIPQSNEFATWARGNCEEGTAVTTDEG